MAKKIKPLSKRARRDILLKLADHIKRYPERYNFFAHGDHLKSSEPMCPLQRVASFLKLRDGKDGPVRSALDKAAQALGYAEAIAFYRAADNLLSDMRDLSPGDSRRCGWLLRADSITGTTTTQVVLALRLMAYER